MRIILITFVVLVAASCMKTRKEYEEAISDVRQEQQAEEEQNPHRARGENDREGMGMDE